MRSGAAHARPPLAAIAAASGAATRARRRRCCPAPIVSTTSPSRTMSASARGSSSSAPSSTGSTRPRERIARHSAFASAPAIGGSPAGVDLGDDERVRLREHLGEVVEQVARARVAVRLEHQHDAPIGPALARGLERRRDLGRVMAVVVDQRRCGRAPVSSSPSHLQPPVDALELRERALDRLVADLELGRDRDRGERVQHVVPARQVQRDRQRLARRPGGSRRSCDRAPRRSTLTARTSASAPKP